MKEYQFMFGGSDVEITTTVYHNDRDCVIFIVEPLLSRLTVEILLGFLTVMIAMQLQASYIDQECCMLTLLHLLCPINAK